MRAQRTWGKLITILFSKDQIFVRQKKILRMEFDLRFSFSPIDELTNHNSPNQKRHNHQRYFYNTHICIIFSRFK